MSSYWYTWFPGACLAFLGLLTFIYKGIAAFVRVQRIVPMMEKVVAEVSPNSGHSMRDQVDQLKAGQTAHVEEFKVFKAEQRVVNQNTTRRLNRQDQQLDRIERSIHREN